MNKHHEELGMQFGLLIGIQKELKQSFDVVESTWQTKNDLPYLVEINRWEEEVINRIRQIAAKARTTASEMMAKNMSDIHRRLDQLAFDMEQRQQEGNYLDNDIAAVKNQLEHLDNTVKHVNEKIRINYTATNKINWESLIYVTTNKKFLENRFNFPEFHFEQDSSQEKIWNNFKKLIRNKHTNNDYKNKQSSFKRSKSTLFEPIVLTSFGSSTCYHAEQKSYAASQSTTFDNFQSDSFSDDESFNHMKFNSIDHDHLLSQASDA
jgi:hypothetical protein